MTIAEIGLLAVTAPLAALGIGALATIMLRAYFEK